MTALDTAPAGFHSTEAARGARRARIAEIEMLYHGIRDDIEAERADSLAGSVARSLQRIRDITTGVEVDDQGRLIGPALRIHIVTRKLAIEALDMRQERWGIEFRFQIALDAAELARITARAPFDFGLVAS